MYSFYPEISGTQKRTGLSQSFVVPLFFQPIEERHLYSRNAVIFDYGI